MVKWSTYLAVLMVWMSFQQVTLGHTPHSKAASDEPLTTSDAVADPEPEPESSTSGDDVVCGEIRLRHDQTVTDPLGLADPSTLKVAGNWYHWVKVVKFTEITALTLVEALAGNCEDPTYNNKPALPYGITNGGIFIDVTCQAVLKVCGKPLPEYTYNEKLLDQDGAATQCRNAELMLILPRSQAEIEAIISAVPHFSDPNARHSYRHGLYTGYQDKDLPRNSSLWMNGQPKWKEGRTCVSINMVNKGLMVTRCTNQVPVVCQKLGNTVDDSAAMASNELHKKQYFNDYISQKYDDMYPCIEKDADFEAMINKELW